MGKDGEHEGDGPPVMGRSEGYKSKDIGPVMFRKHANEIWHCYESDLKMRNSRTLWSLITPGMLFALNWWLKTQNKAPLIFKYPGSTAAAQKKFATLETGARIILRSTLFSRPMA